MSLPFHEEAADERDAALSYYREIDPDLAEDLDRALEERLARAVRMPGVSRIEPSTPERFELRWYRIRRFPYALLIGIVDSQRVVVAVAHHSQRPGYWRDRLE